MSKNLFPTRDDVQPARKTNVDIVTDFMSFGSPLRQAFVMEAIHQYAKTIKAHEAELKANTNSFINGADWVACAYDWQQAQPK